MNALVSVLFILLNILVAINDIKKRKIENWPLILIILLSLCDINKYSIIGALMFSSILYILYILKPNSIGGGDVKFMFVSGLFLKAPSIILSWYIMLLVALLLIFVVYLRRKDIRSYPIPLGTCLAVGNILTLICVHFLRM